MRGEYASDTAIERTVAGEVNTAKWSPVGFIIYLHSHLLVHEIFSVVIALKISLYVFLYFTPGRKRGKQATLSTCIDRAKKDGEIRCKSGSLISTQRNDIVTRKRISHEDSREF